MAITSGIFSEEVKFEERLKGSLDELAKTVEHLKGIGLKIVLTSGSFDLIHLGHVKYLAKAKALGDVLVVGLNSDASVRRLKGPERPLVSQEDRAAVLRALECVDAVIVFGEDTPVDALRGLRPDVWAKGGDYSPAELPEVPALAEWGGRVVILPYVEGHSTTRLIAEAAFRG